MKNENVNEQFNQCHPEHPTHVILNLFQDLIRDAECPQHDSLREQSGRSMVEMLGVLAIIGVLSIMGIAGYKAAMTRHRANELLNEASKRAVVVAGQITLHGHNPSLSEFNEKDFSGGSFETTVYGASGDAEWTNADQRFTLSITGVEGSVCEQMRGTANNTIKNFAPATCDTTNPNNVKLTYNNDLGPEEIEPAGNTPTTPSTCAENNMYWCPTSQTCVANQAACLTLCPQNRLCGETCCGEGNICVDGNKCCKQDWYEEYGDEGSCCSTDDSTGFVANYDEPWCCENTTVPYNATMYESFCCPNNYVITHYEDFTACCPEGQTGYIVYNNDEDDHHLIQGCCSGTVSKGTGEDGADECLE